jgi:Fe-S-cluster containining protein
MKGRYYKLSDSLESILNSVPEETKSIIVEGMDHYIREYKNKLQNFNSESVAYGFMKLVDQNIKDTLPPIGEKISCKKGCAYCCSINVDISAEEAILLINYCEKNKIEIDWQKLEIQKEYNHTNYLSLDKESRKCVFLSNDNICKVYKYRPISCRKYASLDKPKKCDSNDGDRKIKRFASPTAEIIACAVMTATEFKPMASLLLKYKKHYGKTN